MRKKENQKFSRKRREKLKKDENRQPESKTAMISVILVASALSISLMARSYALEEKIGDYKSQRKEVKAQISAEEQRTKEIEALKEKIAAIGKTEENKLMLVGDLMHPGDMAVLVIPIDKAAPKGRLILPQQQVIRDILDSEGAAVCVKEYELRETLEKFKEPPAIVITDSQVFAKVSADVPESIPLTSFSILMARHKGLLDTAVRGIAAV